MKCPGCGYESFDLLETCKRCGAPMVATTGAPEVPSTSPAAGERLEPEHSAPGQRLPGRGRHRAMPGGRFDRGADLVEMLDDDAIEVGADDLDGALVAGPGSRAEDARSVFRVEDDLFAAHETIAGVAPGPSARDDRDGFWSPSGADLPGPAFVLSGEDAGAGCGEPIIDRYDEVPERYWAPEVAGLGRRALALLVDHSVLIFFLGIFFLGAFIALRFSGFDADVFLDAAALQVSALPFALLAVVLSLVYFGFFHGSTGRTPGKTLLDLEVRTNAGSAPTGGQVLRRWLGSVLGLACAGVGIFWAMFEPRRRGWADLISGTVVARQRRGEFRTSGLGADERREAKTGAECGNRPAVGAH